MPEPRHDSAAPPASAPPRRGGRLASLDGLRGVAAVIVLVHHSFLIVPALAAPYYGGAVDGGWIRILVSSPLHLAWAGTEAVYLFFVLSGLVLALSVRATSFSWSSYFPARIVRLYLPVVFAVLFAAIMIAVFPRGRAGESIWLHNRPRSYDVSAMLTDVTLVNGTTGAVSPLWSLRWEVLFSVLLPVAILAMRRVPVWIQMLLYLGVSTVGVATGVGALQYLPMFGLGVALSTCWERIGATFARVRGARSGFFWSGFVAISLLLVASYWMTTTVLSYDTAATVTIAPILAGVVGLVIAAGWAPGLRRLLTSKILVLLGMLSFSLYLVHEPIVVAIGSVVPEPKQTVLFSIPVSLLAAVAFYFAVERPSHLISRRIRRAVQASETEPVGLDRAAVQASG